MRGWVEPENDIIRMLLAGPIALPRFELLPRAAFVLAEVAPPAEVASMAPAPTAHPPMTAPAHVFEDELYEAEAAAPIPFPGRAA